MQAVTIFFPIFESYKIRAAARSIPSELEEWEEENTASTLASNPGNRAKRSSDEKSAHSSTPERYWSMDTYGMPALKVALATYPQALLQFAATKDFTAENIIFLLHIQAWRTACGEGSRRMADIPADERMQLFKLAVDIYAECISEKTAEFPINIEGPVRARLDAIFKPAISASKGKGNADAVASATVTSGHSHSIAETLIKESEIVTVHARNSSLTTNSETENKNGSFPSLICGPDGLTEYFDERVFDAAEKSINYLVLTNTWRKFVDDVRQQIPDTSSEGLRIQ